MKRSRSWTTLLCPALLIALAACSGGFSTAPSPPSNAAGASAQPPLAPGARRVVVPIRRKKVRHTGKVRVIVKLARCTRVRKHRTCAPNRVTLNGGSNRVTAIGGSNRVTAIGAPNDCHPERSECNERSRRTPAYLSPATQSIVLVYTPQGEGTTVTQSANLTVGSDGCASTLATVQCTLPLQDLPSGSWTLTVSTYDGPLDGNGNPTGNLLSTAQEIAFVVQPNQTTKLAVTLSGVPVATVVLPADDFVQGNGLGGYDLLAQGPHAFVAETLDADGDVIAGPGAPTFEIGTPSGALAGASVSTSQTTTAAPNAFSVTPPTAYASGTATFTVTPNFSGQPTDGCAQTGADCAAVTVTVDMQPLIYVANSAFAGTVTAYDQNGNQRTLSGSFPNLVDPTGIAEDPSNGWLYVTNERFSGPVTAYDRNGDQQTLSGGFPNLSYPLGITYDSSNGWFYVSNCGTNAVTAYDANGNQQTLSGGFPNLGEPAGIADDPVSDWLYVTNFSSSTVTAYDQNGDQQTLSGFADLSNPYGIVYDPSNEWFYVANAGNSTVTAYDANGDSETLSGGFPNLNGPEGIAYDPANGWLYVTNRENNTVTAYDQSGNQQTLSGGFPNLTYPLGIAVVP